MLLCNSRSTFMQLKGQLCGTAASCEPPTTGQRDYKLLVPPAGAAAGVPRLVAVEFGDAVALFAGSFSLSPALMRSVVRPFRALISFTVVPLAVAILLS